MTMNAVGRLGSYISRGVGTVSGPFHPFGGAIDIIVVEQPDGSFKSSPWYVRFGKFQGVLKNKKNVIKVCVNDAESGLHMYLDHTGQAYFLREVDEVGAGDSLVSPLSSGDEADGKIGNYEEVRRPMKSKSCNYGASSPTSSNGKMVGRSGILGFVFGQKSMKADQFRDGEDGGSGVERVSSLERAEIAANLLEVKWSTNLDSSLSIKENVSRFSGGGKVDNNNGNGNMQMNNVEDGATEIRLDHIVDNSSSSDDESGQVMLEDKFVVSSEVPKISQVSIGNSGDYTIKDGASGTRHSREAYPSSQLVEERDYYENNGVSQCGGVHDKKSVSEGSDEKTSSDLQISRGGNREIYARAQSMDARTTELLPQDTITNYTVESGNEDHLVTLESVNRMVGVDSTFGLPEEVELGSIGTSHGGSSPDHQVLDENHNSLDDLQHNIESTATSQSTSLTSFPHLDNSEEEQFLFSDLDESKPSEVTRVAMTYIDAVKRNKKETGEQNETSCENTVEMSKMVSSPISINKNHEFSGEESERLVESFPDVRFPIQELEADYPQPLSYSLDSNSKSMKWRFRKDESTSGNPDVEKQKNLVREQVERQLAKEEQTSEDSRNSRALRHIFANPEVEVELSLCKHLLWEGMGSEAASQAFNSEKLDIYKFASLGPAIVKNDKLVVRIGGCYFPWDAAAPIILGMVSFGGDKIFEPKGIIAVDLVEQSGEVAPGGGSWKLWPFRRSRIDGKTVNSSNYAVANDEKGSGLKPKPAKKMIKEISPTSEQLASLNLKEGRNNVTFTFSTKMLGTQPVDARIYLWKWNTRIVISDVDGTITKSDVLGQFMPLVGVDWSQTGVAHLFSAIEENGYQLLFLSARAISQASATRQFLVNLKQNGKALPDGPVVISPDGLFPSLFREVIRRAPHEFKIACLEAIRALFPADSNPFYAGFGNRDTDEISYLRVGIPRGKIFIINPRGEVAVNRRGYTRSYTSLHSLVNGMFPATNNPEQEDFNSWNYWKLPPPTVDV